MRVKRVLLCGERLEIHVPDPADVRAVRKAVIEQESQLVFALVVRDQVDDLVETRRVLDQHHARLCLTERKLLRAAKAALKLAERTDRGLLVNTDYVRHGRSRSRVVDVVPSGQVDVHLMLPAEDIQHHIGGIRSRADHFGHRHVGRMAVIAAFGAAETAQMAVSYIVIFVFGLAVDAIRRVRQFVRGLL